MGRIFGTDGARGVVGVELTAELAVNIGRAAAISWISFFIILAFTVAQKVLEKRWVYYE